MELQTTLTAQTVEAHGLEGQGTQRKKPGTILRVSLAKMSLHHTVKGVWATLKGRDQREVGNYIFH